MGTFLVASRDLGDPNFAKTVILLVHYKADQGAVGLVVNRATDVPISRVFQDLKEAKSRKDPVYVGGPVELNSVMALLKAAIKPENSTRVFNDVYLISQQGSIESHAGVGRGVQRVSRLCRLCGLGRRATGARNGAGRLAHHARRCGERFSLRSRFGLAAPDPPYRNPDRCSIPCIPRLPRIPSFTYTPPLR